MSTTSQITKPGSERLRSSCDNCYISKIKCSKSRPLCSRCLVCGTSCTYSPSGRSGRRLKKTEQQQAGNGAPDGLDPKQLSEQVWKSYEESSTFNSTSETPEDEYSQPFINFGEQLGTPLGRPVKKYDTPHQSDCMDPLLIAGTQNAPISWDSYQNTAQSKPAASWWTDAMPFITNDISDSTLHTQPHPSTAILDTNNSWDTSFDINIDPTDFLSSDLMQSPSTGLISNPMMTPQPLCTCFSDGMAILQSMSKDFASLPPITQDPTLQDNRHALKSFAALLHCSTCLSPDSDDMIMLLAAILEKLIAAFTEISLSSLNSRNQVTDPSIPFNSPTLDSAAEAGDLGHDAETLERMFLEFCNKISCDAYGIHSSRHGAVAAQLSESLGALLALWR